MDMNTGQEYNVSQGGFGGGGFGGGFGGFGGGFGLVGLIGLNNLWGRRDGGECEGGGNCATQALVASTGSRIQDAIQNQNLFLQSQLMGGFSNTKDSIQGAYALLAGQNAQLGVQVQEAACSIKQAIDAEGDSIKALITANRISQLETELLQERSRHHGRDTEISVTQAVNVAQAQSQQQQQQQQILGALHGLGCAFNNFSQWQSGRAAAGAVQFGSGNTATQTPTNSNQQVG